MSRLWHCILMHLTIRSMNCEDAYNDWCFTMPGNPTIDDFESFVYDDEAWEDLNDTFQIIFDEYIQYGLYNPPKDVEDYVKVWYPNAEIIRYPNPHN